MSKPNAALKFFSSHPNPAGRSSNVATLIAGAPVNSKLAALPRPEVEAAKAAAAIAAAARPPAEPEAGFRSRNMVRDRDIAARFAPVFHQALGPAPRFDYITNFDLDGDWRGDNNWATRPD